MWISPQEVFIIGPDILLIVPILGIEIGFTNLLISVPFVIVGAYFGIAGVKATGVKVSETHRAEFIVTDGVYKRTRHPQYLGAVLSHIGMSILLSAAYSLLATFVVIIATYLTARKEEVELVREFGSEYEEYKSRVRMFI
jgi:protein-S-isoprenylcysteine O-methyltransferase Ste14